MTDQNKALAHKYGITEAQVNSLVHLSDTLNAGELKGTGLVTVPLWFVDQYDETNELNKALAAQIDRLLLVIGSVAGESELVQPSTNIITGLSEPYIPGETGPRIGDEHLSADHLFPDGVDVSDL